MRTRYKSRTMAATALIASLALAITGCSGSDDNENGNGNGGTTEPGQETFTVGATVLSLEYPFLVNLNESLVNTAGAEGIELTSLDPRQDTATELTQVEDLITKGVDAIIMIPVDQESSQAAARQINEANIPFFMVNTRFTDDFTGDYVSYIGSDDTEAGRIQGQYLRDTLSDGGKVIYLVGQYGGASTERRKAGFYEALEGADNIEIVTELEALGSRAEAKTVMEDLLQRYGSGEVQAVITQSDEMAIGAASAIQEAGRSDEFSIIMGVDGSEAGLDAIADGSITATVFQNAEAQGRVAMETVAKYLKGEDVDKEIDIPFELVTAENLSDYR